MHAHPSAAFGFIYVQNQKGFIENLSECERNCAWEHVQEHVQARQAANAQCALDISLHTKGRDPASALFTSKAGDYMDICCED